jgi:hypothetical protein
MPVCFAQTSITYFTTGKSIVLPSLPPTLIFRVAFT